MGRKAVGDRAMTPAERKARERRVRAANLDAALHMLGVLEKAIRDGQDADVLLGDLDVVRDWVVAARDGNPALADALHGLSAS
jgi:hypothetical protein